MLYLLILVVVVIGILAWFLRPRPSFEILVRSGGAIVTRGRAPHQFLDDCVRICTDLRVDSATIRGFGEAERVSLRFSKNIRPAHQQRFRNAWHVSAR